MTTIVGWQNDLVASAALLVDGTLVAAVEEERFTRVKQQSGFPRRSVEWILANWGLAPADVDEWAYGYFAGVNTDALLPDLVRRVATGEDAVGVAVMADRLRTERENDVEIRDAGYAEAAAWGVDLDRVVAYEHHPSHAWSAHAFSPFETSLVVTFDGRGDRKSSSLSRADATGVHELEWRSSIDSLGHVYSQVTHVLGYRTNRHEGKITGLAGHGDGTRAKEFLRLLVDFQDGVVVTRPGRDFVPTDRDVAPHVREQMLAFPAEDLAAGIQDLTEELVCRFVSDRAARYGLRDLSLAGGLFANVQLNRRLRELPGVDRVFVQPSMGDAGLALGAAAAASFARTSATKVVWANMFLGPDPGPAPSLDELKSEETDTASWVADALIRGDIVGLVCGRSEFGPRALGHRTILATTSDARINDTLNRRLARTEFMPFAPVMRECDAARSLEGWTPQDACSPYMTMAYSCSAEFARRHPAVVHVDRTARPEVVTPESDPWLHDLLSRYHRATGRWALINTSFNRHDEPIVLTLGDALPAVAEGVVDAVTDATRVWTRR